MSFQIAVDGPAGAGKSTIAKRIAKELGFLYVDTGAMYRAIALYLLRNGVDCDREEDLAKALEKIEVSLSYEDDEQQIFLNGENVSALIRTEEVSQMASRCSAKPAVRAKLLNLQRSIADLHDVCMDGRDIGTFILPNAQAKVFLTASLKARSQRRFLQLKEKGMPASMEEVEEEIKERDFRDTHRKTAPLKQAPDALYLDTSDLSIEEVTQKILALVNTRRETISC